MLIDVVVTAYQEHMIVEHERMAEKDRAFLEERLARQASRLRRGCRPDADFNHRPKIHEQIGVHRYRAERRT